ncbi:MAG: hypothetical protein A4E45_00877 [Methanosaeta sp. PtaB.Bin039]|nr:MAG: hypothetical protein A4E45_00877 [Methanosaeta sp. PtaB.Bin039]OPY44667.1 MAG: hypothetical protein A4E47_01357 [Methanosaeta sp. PtaU1.Bin028]
MLYGKTTAALSAVFLTLLLLSPASGVNSNFGTESSTGEVSIAGKYSIAQAGSLTDQASLGLGTASRKLEASSDGQSTVTESISGRDSSKNSFSISKTASVDGRLQTSSSAMATPQGGLLSQETDLAGSGGLFAIQSDSPSNTMAAAASFSDDGFLSSTISGAAQDRSALVGGAQVMGVSCFDQQSADILSSGDMGMTVSGLYMSGDGVQKFGLAARNEERSGQTAQTSYGTIPADADEDDYANWNDPRAYVLQGYRWTNNPNLKLYLRTDTALYAEGLSSVGAAGGIAIAANAWDSPTRNLFANTGLVTSSGYVSVDRYDGRNVHAWKKVYSDALAYSRTYYTTRSDLKVGTYYRALESDVVYNARWGWTTDLAKTRLVRDSQGNAIPEYSILDLQTVATHELGHTVGMGDTYLHSLYKYDLAQIMGFYNAPQRSLGLGDAAGIKKLYG